MKERQKIRMMIWQHWQGADIELGVPLALAVSSWPSLATSALTPDPRREERKPKIPTNTHPYTYLNLSEVKS